MALLVVYVPQQGFSPPFPQENYIKFWFQMVQKNRGGGLYLCVMGQCPDGVDEVFGIL